MRKSDQRKSRERIGFDLLIELARPLPVAEEVGECVVKAPEAQVGSFNKRRDELGKRPEHASARARFSDVDIDLKTTTQVQEEAIVPDLEVCPNGRIPDIAQAFFTIRSVGCDFIGRAGQQVGIEFSP